MTYRPFRSLGRIMLAACAVSLGVASLGAQTPAPNAPAIGAQPVPGRYVHRLLVLRSARQGESRPACLTRRSIVARSAAARTTSTGTSAARLSTRNHPDGTNDGVSSAARRSDLPRSDGELHAVRAWPGWCGDDWAARTARFRATFEHEPYRWGPALTAGGGMDYDLPFFNNRFSLRLFQADYRYIHEDFGPPATIPTGGMLGGRTNLKAVELSTGIVTHFGHIIPPPPVTLCLRGRSGNRLSWRSVHGYRHGAEPEPEEDTRPIAGPRRAERSPARPARAHRHDDRGTGHLHGDGSCDGG